MPLPGLSFGGAVGLSAVIATSTNTPVDLAALLGVDSSAAVVYRLFVPSGVTQGSTAAATPAIDATGLHADSVGYWFVDGTIVGKGGNGGNGGANGSFVFGGGGGGAGAAVGTGGTATAPATAGADGTATTGGAGGNTAASALVLSQTSPQNGGDAVALSHTVVAVVTGGVRGAGGGGAPGSGVSNGYAGGDLDTNGGGAPVGLKGYAVRLSGSGAWSASGGGTVGTVG